MKGIIHKYKLPIIMFLVILMLILFCVATNTNTHDRVTKLMDTACQTTVADAKQDSLRRQEVTAKKSSISYYDFESDDIKSLEMDWDLAYAAHISFSSLGFDD